MSSRKLFASLLVAGLSAAGFVGTAQVANAVSAGASVIKAADSSATNVIKVRGRGNGRRFYVPIAPSYSGYDYPYYYSRGYFPTSIGRGYVYYGKPYSYYVRNYNARYGSRCLNGGRGCTASLRYERGFGSLRRSKVRRD
jgi:hypothetical protein